MIAVEPVSANLAALRANLAHHGFSEAVTIVAAALSAASAAAADMTVYPHMPGNSTLEPAEKVAAQSLFMRAEMFADSSVERCEVRTLSDVIDDQGLQCVDLLKVDVEGSELRVLEGVAEQHWPLVKQVVVEVLDVADRLAVMVALLASVGFRVKTVPGEPACNVMLYATRMPASNTPSTAQNVL